jgi:hypothetical protein
MGSESLEYNVIVVKWGDKFTSEHVNRLYRMAKRNITLPFNFYCYTEDPTEIYDEVNIIPLDETLNLEKWWWKLTLFKANDLGNGINIFLDLDVVIQSNINHFFTKSKHNKIVILDYGDIEMVREIEMLNFDPYTSPHYNSSVMIWYNNENKDIYEKFVINHKLYTKIYHGIDRFFSYEISSYRFVELDYNDYYYRTREKFNEPDNQSDFIKLTEETEKFPNKISVKVFYNKNVPVCVFNGCHENVFYQGMEKFLL